MMASNTESVYDFDFAPKRTVATYGKASRRRAPASRPATLRHSDSAPAAPTSSRRSESASPEPPRPAARALSSLKLKPQSTRSNETRKDSAQGSHSQPAPDPYDFDFPAEETARPKKRRIARATSEKEKPASFYSTPDSSPSGGQSPGSPSEEDAPKSTATANVRPKTQRVTPERDVSMKDAAPPSMPFSATTTRRLKNLKVSAEPLKLEKKQFPIRAATQPPSKPAAERASRQPSAPTRAEAQPPVAKAARKRRLIDALAAQAEEEASSSQDDEAPYSSVSRSPGSSPLLRDSPPPPPATPGRSQPIVRTVLPPKKTGPKFTYSQQRTMLADEDPILGGGGGLGDFGAALGGSALFNFGRPNKSSAFDMPAYMEEDDETANGGAVRSLHELRQAGANSRFADEMDDILDRVGSPSAKPSSLRRGALLELAQKMKNKDFRQQFRNHNDGDSLFKSLEKETDLVSGYAILAIVATLLDGTTSAHLVRQLRSQGFAALIARFLDQTTDIAQLSKDRKQNVSRNAQNTIAAIKSSLLELSVWEPFSLTTLSPRALALKCLDLLMRQPAHVSVEDDVLTGDVTDRLFSILEEAVSEPAFWDFPNQPGSCDLHLGLSILEGYSIYAMQSPLNSTWTEQYATTVADALETAMARPADSLADLENLTLRLALNITNQNPEACRLFADKGLLRLVAQSAAGAFGSVLKSISTTAETSAMSKALMESLIMMLGVMINFCVYYPPAARALEEEDTNGANTGSADALSQLIRVFAENHTKTADADSMEKTQLNVALGYLAVLLGYLCLNRPIRATFVNKHPKKSVQPLRDSIDEFIVFHQKVAEAQQATTTAAADSGSGSLARLQTLANQLAAMC
ncbi:hypothetical protein VTJ83DRAFT_5878 [Remersonia thermophila]|uniref:Wings apart-like protein C-terminal domain-containing protein n=1 Tax=Remersonia thermophila TaxID=72144 RepID=A0ABR4D9Q0_9PEZI